MIALARFITERAPHYVMLPIALCWWGGCAALIQPGWDVWIRGLIATDLALLALRIFDDLHSIEEDRQRKPERGLVTGKIKAKSLKRSGMLIVIIIGVLLWQWTLAVAVAALCLYYSLFFRLRKRLPLLLKPWLSNFFFLVFPALANFWLTRSITLEAILLGLFAWLSAIAHEYGHNVRKAEEPNPGPADYTDHLGPKGVARFSVILFVIACLCGAAFALLESLPLGFLIPFALAGLYLAKCGFDLLRNPSQKTAKPVYIAGFAIFLLPLLGLAIQSRIAVF